MAASCLLSLVEIEKHKQARFWFRSYQSIFIYLFLFFLQMIPVAANDVAFSIHAVFVTSSIIFFQIVIYDVSVIPTLASMLNVLLYHVYWCLVPFFIFNSVEIKMSPRFPYQLSVLHGYLLEYVFSQLCLTTPGCGSSPSLSKLLFWLS